MSTLQRVAWLCIATAALALDGCGSSNASSAGSGQVRVVNATHDHAGISMAVAGVATITGVGANSASSYATVASGSPVLTIADAGTQTTLISLAPSVVNGQSYALIVYESQGALRTTWTTENDTAPAAGSANLRVMTAAVDAGPLDVYITAPGVPLSTVGSASFTMAVPTSTLFSPFSAYTPGNYEVRVTAAGNKNDLRLDIPSITLTDQQLATITLTPTAGGVLLDGGLLIEQGTFTATVNNQARVRLVSGANGGVVTAGTATQTLEAGAVSPLIDAYVTVPSGAAVWSATVGGQAVAIPPISLVAGTDNTLVISGSGGAYAANLITDDNRAPTVSGAEKIRLVNASSGTAAGLSMSVDFTSVASNVLAGQASGYSNIPSNISTRLEVNTPSSITPISLQTGLSFTAGNVYSVFVLGDVGAPAVVVRKDR